MKQRTKREFMFDKMRRKRTFVAALSTISSSLLLLIAYQNCGGPLIALSSFERTSESLCEGECPSAVGDGDGAPQPSEGNDEEEVNDLDPVGGIPPDDGDVPVVHPMLPPDDDGVVPVPIPICVGECPPQQSGDEVEDEPEVPATSMGPLRVSVSNSRYFADSAGKAIYLTGSHHWNTLIDKGTTDPPPSFDYTSHLNFLRNHNHNFIRLWTWELFKSTSNKDGTFSYSQPLPWKRTGVGKALDGKLKFDLNQFDESYFERLRSRVIAARDRGIYVSIMLFEGWGFQFIKSSWRWDGHPFNANNNVNGIDGDPNKDGTGLEAHTLQIAAITAIQKSYVKKVIDTVNDLDNVLYEISNEDHANSINWQYYFINFIKDYEKKKSKQHPVGMTTHNGMGNDVVFNSPADWISPAAETWGDPNDVYKVDPPLADGKKVLLLDTDHIWGIGGNRVWVWKSFMRGYNPLFMDDLDSGADKQGARQAMGHTLSYAERVNLTAMIPSTSLCSTTYCLVSSGLEYLVYQPSSNTAFTVKLEAGTYDYEWFNPATGKIASTGTFTVISEKKSFTAPFSNDAVLFIVAVR